MRVISTASTPMTPDKRRLYPLKVFQILSLGRQIKIRERNIFAAVAEQIPKVIVFPSLDWTKISFHLALNVFTNLSSKYCDYDCKIFRICVQTRKCVPFCSGCFRDFSRKLLLCSMLTVNKKSEHRDRAKSFFHKHHFFKLSSSNHTFAYILNASRNALGWSWGLSFMGRICYDEYIFITKRWWHFCVFAFRKKTHLHKALI